jgi:Tol biopolymer transport system component
MGSTERCANGTCGGFAALQPERPYDQPVYAMEPSPTASDPILEQLTRVLSSSVFQNATRSRALLRFLVEETVNGRAGRLKEYTLGVEGLGRGDSFDPRSDPIVRAEASRLRDRLERYYAGEGRGDAVVIELPKGGYVPQFRTRDATHEGHRSTRPNWGALRSQAKWIWVAVGTVAVVLTVARLWTRPEAPSRDANAVRFDVELTRTGVLSSEVGTDVILSPDGTRMVFVSEDSTGLSRLNTRQLDQASAIELAGTEGARGPFFSPDGQWVAFWADSKLKKIAVAGGPPQILCDAPDLLGGSWGDDGYIVAALSRTQLSRISASGGSAVVIVDLSAESTVPRWPQVLPGAKFVLFTAMGTQGPNAATINLLSLSNHVKRVLVRNGTFGRYLANGYLTYVNQGTLFAVDFDVERMEVRGTAVPVLADVAYSSTFGFAQMDVSRTGTLVYRRSLGGGQFIANWIDETGRTEPLLTKPGHYIWPRLSPDGQRLTVSATESGTDIVSVYDRRLDQMTRLTSLDGKYGFPLWTRDGTMLVLGGAGGLAAIDPDGARQSQVLLRSDTIQVPWSFSPDGQRLAYHQMSVASGFDLWTVPVHQTAHGVEAGKPEPFLQTGAFEVYPAFSPDGRWLAYGSNESGTWEIYVRAFPDNGTKSRVSSTGGRIPLWPTNGNELLYETDHQHIMAITYTVVSGSFVAGKPRAWSRSAIADTGVLANFDVSSDGRRIVALLPAAKPGDDQTQNHATFILNFFDAVRRQVLAAAK